MNISIVMLCAIIILGFSIVIAILLKKGTSEEDRVNVVNSCKAETEEILRERSARFKEESKEAIESIIAPLKEDIVRHKEELEKAKNGLSDDANIIKGQIQLLNSQSQGISKQAGELAAALRGKDVQKIGCWGEIQLLKVLEMSGLKRGTDYEYQESYAPEDSGRKSDIIDVLVHMPEGRYIVIDAKTTLASFVNYACPEEGQDAEAAKAEVIKAIKAHVDEMGKKDYAKNLAKAKPDKEVLDTMLMYIPLDDVYGMAMSEAIGEGDNRKMLRDYAWEKNVLFVNSMSLLPILTMVNKYWMSRKAFESSQDIVKKAEEICEKISVAIGHMAELGKNVQAVQASYSALIRCLVTGNGNLLKKIEDMKELGVKAANEPETKDVENIKNSSVENPEFTKSFQNVENMRSESAGE